MGGRVGKVRRVVAKRTFPFSIDDDEKDRNKEADEIKTKTDLFATAAPRTASSTAFPAVLGGVEATAKTGENGTIEIEGTGNKTKEKKNVVDTKTKTDEVISAESTGTNTTADAPVQSVAPSSTVSTTAADATDERKDESRRNSKRSRDEDGTTTDTQLGSTNGSYNQNIEAAKRHKKDASSNIDDSSKQQTQDSSVGNPAERRFSKRQRKTVTKFQNEDPAAQYAPRASDVLVVTSSSAVIVQRSSPLMAQILQKNRAAYRNAPRTKKLSVATTALSQFTKRGGRILERKYRTAYKTVSDRLILPLVMQALHNGEEDLVSNKKENESDFRHAQTSASTSSSAGAAVPLKKPPQSRATEQRQTQAPQPSQRPIPPSVKSSSKKHAPPVPAAANKTGASPSGNSTRSSSSYTIPKKKLPKSSTEAATNTKNQQSAGTAKKKKKKKVLSNTEPKLIVNEPNQNDVLFGKGNHITTFPGNLFFRNLVRESREEYNKTKSKTEKQVFARAIIANIHNLDPPGRFLELHVDSNTGTTTFTGANITRVVDKTLQALRDSKRVWTVDNHLPLRDKQELIDYVASGSTSLTAKPPPTSSSASKKASPDKRSSPSSSKGSTNHEKPVATKTAAAFAPKMSKMDTIAAAEHCTDPPASAKKKVDPSSTPRPPPSSVAAPAKQATAPAKKKSSPSSIASTSKASAKTCEEAAVPDLPTSGGSKEPRLIPQFVAESEVVLPSSSGGSSIARAPKRKKYEKHPMFSPTPVIMPTRAAMAKIGLPHSHVGPPRQPEQEGPPVKMPHAHDVLFGRGSITTAHPGNLRYRRMVWENKDIYALMSRKEKSEFALDLINTIRNMDPPGRFLEHNERDRTWTEAPVHRIIDKTLQALRERKWSRQTLRWTEESAKAAASRAYQASGSPPSYSLTADAAAKAAAAYHSAVASAPFSPRVPKKQSSESTQRRSTSSSLMASYEYDDDAEELVESVVPGDAVQQLPIELLSGDDIYDNAVFERVKAWARISVYWPLDRTHYNARILDKQKYDVLLQYEDDDLVEWVDLTRHSFKLLS